MNNLIIEPKYLKMLKDIISSYNKNIEVWAYGSRVDGSAHDGSDLDLVVRNQDNDFELYELRRLLTESNIPFLIDINVFDELPEYFQKEILKNYVVI